MSLPWRFQKDYEFQNSRYSIKGLGGYKGTPGTRIEIKPIGRASVDRLGEGDIKIKKVQKLGLQLKLDIFACGEEVCG